MVLETLSHLLASVSATTHTGVNSPNVFLPIDASVTGDEVDWTMWMINYITIFFGAAVIIAMVYFVIRYRYREGGPEEGHGTSHSTTLEITWTLIPTLIVLVIFTFGFRGFLSSQIAPTDAIPMTANGKMWNWYFSYPDADGRGDPELWIPVNEPVQITLDSSDVIHSLYIPAFRVKKDVVPGRYNRLWFQADKEGTYEIFCAEYCGTGHSKMHTKAHVVSRERYEKEMKRISDPFQGGTVPPAVVGQQIWENQGCQTCHSVDGSIKQAPSWKGIWMEEQPLSDGTSVVADEAYISESIKYPSRKLVAGFGPVMPSYAAQLSDREINAVIQYIQTLSDGYKVGPDGQVIGPENTSLGGPDVEKEAGKENAE